MRPWTSNLSKVTDLEPLRYLDRLELLSLEDIPKVRSIEPVAHLSRLVALDFSGGMWNKNRAETLEPIGRLPVLEELYLTNLRVDSGGLRPLARCRALRRLRLSNQFPTEDYAYLAAKLPVVECEMFAPCLPMGYKIGDKDVMVVGKRKPFLNATADAERMARYARDFERMKAAFIDEAEDS